MDEGGFEALGNCERRSVMKNIYIAGAIAAVCAVAIVASSRSVVPDLMVLAPTAGKTLTAEALFTIEARFNVACRADVVDSSGAIVASASWDNGAPDSAGYSNGPLDWTPTTAGTYHIRLTPTGGGSAVDAASFNVKAAATPAVAGPTIDNWTILSVPVVKQDVSFRVDFTAGSSATASGWFDKNNWGIAPVMGAGTAPSTGSATFTTTFLAAGTHTLKFKVTDGAVSATSSINFEVPATSASVTVTAGVTDVVCPQYVIAGQSFNLTFDYAPATATPTATMIASDGSSMPMVAGSNSGGFATFSGTFTISGPGKIVVNVDSLPPFTISVTVLGVGTIVVPPMPKRIILSVGPGLAVSSGGRRTPFPGITAVRLGQDVVAPVPAKYQDYLSNDWIVGSERIGPRSTVIGFRWTREGNIEFAVGTREQE